MNINELTYHQNLIQLPRTGTVRVLTNENEIVTVTEYDAEPFMPIRVR